MDVDTILRAGDRFRSTFDPDEPDTPRPVYEVMCEPKHVYYDGVFHWSMHVKYVTTDGARWDNATVGEMDCMSFEPREVEFVSRNHSPSTCPFH